MKAFISLKMNGRPDNEVQEDMNKALEILKEDMKNEERLEETDKLELIQTIKHEDAPLNAPRLWYLGASIQKLADADVVYFYDKWWRAKGCWVEFIAANIYDKETVYDFPNRRIMRKVEEILRLIFSTMDSIIDEPLEEDEDV